MAAPATTFVPSATEREELLSYLRTTYAGVFDETAVDRHLVDYIGFTFVDQVLPTVAQQLPQGARLLDVGCGFGSFVLAARERGLDAVGIEIAPFEVDFARRRLARVRPQDDPERVFLLGDVHSMEIGPGSLDAVSAWNLLEHVADYRAVLAAVARMLKSGGKLYVICPNYLAFRLEAHYLVPWRPLLTRAQAVARLKRFGKDPAYFERGIFPLTNWGVLHILFALGFEPYDLGMGVSMDLALAPRKIARVLRHPRAFAGFYNPFKDSVILTAVKRATP